MIIDAVLFAGEAEMLELRVRTLQHIVDVFVVVTCSRTHQGQPAPQVGLPRLPVDNVVLHCVDPSLEVQRKSRTYRFDVDHRGGARTPLYQAIEKQHRSGVIDAVAAARVRDPGALIMVSDVDEVPNPHILAEPLRVLDRMPPHTAMVFAQRFHSTALDLLHPHQPWLGTTISRLADIDPQAHRDARAQLPAIPRGGWHFSWFGTDMERQRKLDTFSHAELRSWDPAEGRRTRTHVNGEVLRKLTVDELQHLDWPRPLRDGTFNVPRHFWADT